MTLEEYATYLGNIAKKQSTAKYVKKKLSPPKKMISKQFFKTKKTKYAKRRF